MVAQAQNAEDNSELKAVAHEGRTPSEAAVWVLIILAPGQEMAL